MAISESTSPTTSQRLGRASLRAFENSTMLAGVAAASGEGMTDQEAMCSAMKIAARDLEALCAEIDAIGDSLGAS